MTHARAGLSILYLRCIAVRCILPSPRRLSPLSILYLRCRLEVYTTLHNLVKMSFNSLFEMRRLNASVGYPAKLGPVFQFSI